MLLNKKCFSLQLYRILNEYNLKLHNTAAAYLQYYIKHNVLHETLRAWIAFFLNCSWSTYVLESPGVDSPFIRFENPHEHTGLICFRSFQNYAFKKWLSLQTMKLWLLVLTKPLFLMNLIIKLTLGNIFIKLKNPPGGATFTK